MGIFCKVEPRVRRERERKINGFLAKKKVARIKRNYSQRGERSSSNLATKWADINAQQLGL
jgi:hypothetical protein